MSVQLGLTQGSKSADNAGDSSENEEQKEWTLLDDNGKAITMAVNTRDKYMGYMKGQIFNQRYKIQAGKKSHNGKLSFLQMFLKFLQTDSIEISRENHLPMSLLHYKFKKVKNAQEL